MLAEEQIREIAGMILKAEQTRQQMPALTERFPEMTLDEAYRVQAALVEQKLAAGRVAVGKKVALTNHLVQRSLNVGEPVFGILLDDMVAIEDEAVDCTALLQPRIEPEIAFVLKSDLKGPGVTVGKALAATAGVVPAFEIPASPIRDWRFAVQDIAACNAFAASLVLGGHLVPIENIDLRLVGVMLEQQGKVIATGAGAAALGNPVDVLVWLANTLAKYGQQLNAGDIVLSGTLTLAADAHPGEHFRATFDRLGAVSARFAG